MGIIIALCIALLSLDFAVSAAILGIRDYINQLRREE